MNKLASETSTYLLQHANNPVDWYPWGKEALDRSLSEDKPILLSIGYAACHWCHVMEHESFEDVETAQVMNENYICIKVDREERTDLDEIYMKAVQLMTGQGGWPMTVFLTPQLKPFFGGTYFPPVEKHGLPGFKKLLMAVNKAWLSKRDELEQSAQALTTHLTSMNEFAGNLEGDQNSSDSEREEIIVRAAEKLLTSFDQTWGGFGGAPKFPHTFSLDLAMRCMHRPLLERQSLKSQVTAMVTTSLNRMAQGGIHDQIGGGFARYATDREWLVPHFEKMLYDNALLCQTYFNGFRLSGNVYWKNVAEGILDFVIRDLTCPEKAFYSSLDADSEGEEGKYYVWTVGEIEEILGPEAGWFCQIYGVSQAGNFEHSTNILHLKNVPDEQSWTKLQSLNQKLLAERYKRVPPGTDKKVLTSWNGLMISAFVDGYAITGKEKYLQAAKDAANFLLKVMTKDGRLLRTWGGGRAQLNAYLDDYAYFTQALLDLAGVDGDPKWLTQAILFNESAIRHFQGEDKSKKLQKRKFFETSMAEMSDPAVQETQSDGKYLPGFFYTSDDHETLLVRPRSEFDGAVPSASAIAVLNLLRLSEIVGNEDYRKIANATIRSYDTLLESAPDQLSSMICAQDFQISNPMALVLSLPAKDASHEELLLALHRRYMPNKVVVVLNETTHVYPVVSLLKDKKAGEKPTVFVCQNFSCQAPVTSFSDLNELFSQLGK